METCPICGEPLRLSWTFCTHLAQCTNCGSCYWARPDETVELAILPEYVELFREYWNTTRQPMPSDYWNFGEGRYEVANREQSQAFSDWLSARIPQEQEEAVA